MQPKNALSIGATITIGSFDGVHLGHQRIIHSLVKQARQNSSAAVVVTFFPHPAKVLRQIEEPFYLNTPDEKINLLQELGVDTVHTIEFTPEFAKTPAEKFIRELFDQLKFSCLMVGHGFKLGANREGDLNLLKQLGNELGYSVTALAPIKSENDVISSSRIRKLLNAGEIKQANNMLGRCYELKGEIVHGDGRGKHIGIPTANLSIWNEKIIPSSGVYTSLAKIDEEEHASVVNIGHRPTFYNNGSAQTIEVHLINFIQEIYGQTMRLKFIERIRSEIKFSSAEELMQQIHEDIRQSKEILSHASASKDLSFRP